MTERVAVLIPTRGTRADLLEQARASAIRQAGAVEVLVEVDRDGRGQSATLNRAAARATGDWLTVCHDDDFYVREDAVAQLLAAAQATPEAGAIYSLPQYVDAAGVPMATPPRLAAWMDKHPRLTWGAFPDGLRMHGTGILYRRTWWERVGGWDEHLPACEEYEFHLRLLQAGCLFVACPVVTMAYRQHPGQKSGRRRGTIGRTSAQRRIIRQAIRDRYREAA